MNEQKLRGLLGLAIRARKASAGIDACRMMIRSGKCGVMMLDDATGINTRKKAEELCRKTGTPLIILKAGTIEEAIGKSNMVISVQSGSFAEQFLKANEIQTIRQSVK